MKPNAARHFAGRPRGNFKIVEFANPGGTKAFRITGTHFDGRRVRENYPDHAQAVARLQALEIESANLQEAARPKLTRLTQDQLAACEAAITRLDGKSILDAVDYYLANYEEPAQKITVEKAFAEFIADRTAANLRPHSIASLNNKCHELTTNFGKRHVADITTETLRKMIFKPTRGPKARDGYRRALSAFFNWAQAQRYCASNPVAVIPPVKIERHEPAIMTLEQVEDLLSAAKAHKDGTLVPYLALGLFAALRPTELARLNWDRIDLDAATVTIGADVAKMRGRRIVELSANCVAWLKPYADKKAEIVGKNWRREFDAMKAAAGWGGRAKEGPATDTPGANKPTLRPWTQDIMRHTGISMHLAEHEHEGKTAAWAGNSPDIVQRHYKGLVKRSDAKAFWAIAPPLTRKRKKQKPNDAIESKSGSVPRTSAKQRNRKEPQAATLPA
jgi:integrase